MKIPNGGPISLDMDSRHFADGTSVYSHGPSEDSLKQPSSLTKIKSRKQIKKSDKLMFLNEFERLSLKYELTFGYSADRDHLGVFEILKKDEVEKEERFWKILDRNEIDNLRDGVSRKAG